LLQFQWVSVIQQKSYPQGIQKKEIAKRWKQNSRLLVRIVPAGGIEKGEQGIKRL